MTNLPVALGVAIIAVVFVGSTVGIPQALHYIQNLF